MRPAPSRAAWDAYIGRFHCERPGITEEVLCRATDGTQTPYEWLADGLPASHRVLDVACGSGPLRKLIGAGWIGVDASHSELRAMADRVGAVTIAGDVRELPVRAAACDAVLCSMALMLVEPLDDAITEVARVLRPGGAVRLLLPARRPRAIRDRARYLRLGVALRAASMFPASALYRHAVESFARSGLTIVDDRTRRFRYPITSRADAELFVNSLYLPGVSAMRMAAAVDAAEQWTASSLGIPLRRIVATSRSHERRVRRDSECERRP